MALEIERKYLVNKDFANKLNTLNIQKYDITQYYTQLGDNEKRFRRVIDEKGHTKYFHTTKDIMLNNWLSRVENEQETTEDIYNANQSNMIGRPLHKIRHILYINDIKYEIDRYQGLLYPLCVAEVEFDNINDAGMFAKPDFCDREITDDKRFKNQSLMQLIEKIEQRSSGTEYDALFDIDSYEL